MTGRLACAILVLSSAATAVADPSDTDAPPCDRACTRMYDCAAVNEPPIYFHCLKTCDAHRADALRVLADADCAALEPDALVGAPIQNADCAAIIAARPHHHAAPFGWREALVAHAWCPRGRGPLPAGLSFAADDTALFGNDSVCWTLDGGRLTWTRDGVAWHQVSLHVPVRAGASIGAGRQQLAVCRPPRPEPPLSPYAPRPSSPATSQAPRLQ